MGGEGGEEVVREVSSGYGWWACDGSDVWEDVLVTCNVVRLGSGGWCGWSRGRILCGVGGRFGDVC